MTLSLLLLSLSSSIEPIGLLSVLHSSKIFTNKDDIIRAEKRNQNLLDHLMRVSRGFGKSDRVFGRIARNDAFQTSPLIRFGKRYVVDDGHSEVLAHLLQQYLQQQSNYDESNRYRR
uniref:FMRFamide-related neuropeptide n=1 Tax=Elaeophora elaphi TaxID=1147741 RepID=A0A0R3S2A6_9BILA